MKIQSVGLLILVFFSGCSPVVELIGKKDEKLLEACRTGTIAEVKDWVRKGADVNAKSSGPFAGSSPLHEAAGRGSLPIVRFLITEGADVNASDKEGYTPLFRAGTPGTLEAIIGAGADLSATKDGETVLDWSDRKKFDWKSEILRSHGAKKSSEAPVKQ